MSFEDFYKAYPRKVGPLKAKTAYERALKITTHEEIMSGLCTYKSTKESWRAWMHPATWLNGGHWMDEPPQEEYSPKEFWERQEESKRILANKVVEFKR